MNIEDIKLNLEYLWGVNYVAECIYMRTWILAAGIFKTTQVKSEKRNIAARQPKRLQLMFWL